VKYTKVIIKSKDDLPKKEGFYFVNLITDRKDIIGYNTLRYLPDSDRKMWINYVDWYLIEDTEPSYPEEFVIWAMFKQDDFVKTCDGDFKSRSRNPIEDTGIYYTLSELYSFWLNEIKDK